MSRRRAWCVTINNPTDEDREKIKEMPLKYSIIGEEKGDEGTPHLQCYFELTKAVTLKRLKKWVPRAHIEMRKGTAQEAADYCKKEGQYEETGQISRQGQRTDLKECAAAIIGGKRMRDVATEYPVPFIKFHKGFRALRAITTKRRDTQPEVIVLYGRTGTGKSHKARQLAGPEYYVWTPARGHWFDGYDGETTVIFEEFRGQLPLGTMLSILDKYDCPLQYKGGTTEFVATKIIITSPVEPSMWYKTVGDDKVDQLLRRITTIEKTVQMYRSDG